MNTGRGSAARPPERDFGRVEPRKTFCPIASYIIPTQRQYLPLKGPQYYTEEELIRSLSRQDHAAFEYLYDHYAAALNGVILTIIDDPYFAGDILQEVLVKIWRQIGTYDPDKGRLFTWMHQITRNTAIDATRGKEWKRRKRSRSLSEDEKGFVDNGAAGAGAGGWTGATQWTAEGAGADASDLRGAMGRLKKDHRMLVDMSYFQGFTQLEIAKMLNIPLGTVKTRLRTALTTLKKLITL